ncbi:MAG: molybdopterin oxidoreductase family protein, partial [Pseudomonadota bacterium]
FCTTLADTGWNAGVGDKGDPSGFEPISWDNALDEFAENLLRAEQSHGSEAVWPYFYAGTMGLVMRDGIERLRHVKRYSGQYSTFCTTLADTGWNAGVGGKWGVDTREIVESDLIVVWGANIVHTQVHVMAHIAKARKERGAQMVCIDPYRNATAQSADWHIMLKPGTDGALACAVMHVLFAEDLADREYLARYADRSYEELAAHFATKTPEWASAITGVSVEEIARFARLYGETKNSFIRCGYGFTRSRNGAAQMHAVTCLPAVTGAWAHRGGGALYGHSGIYGLDKSLIEGSEFRDRSIRMLDQSQIGRVLEGDTVALKGGPPVNAMFIQNTNPMMVAPETARVRAGFSRSDLFVGVHEQFMTETAAMADIVLPATSFLEHDDMYYASGHPHLMVAKAVIPPFAEARSNHDVLCALAKRVGAEHPGFHMTPWEIVDATLKASDYPSADTLLEQRWTDRSGSWSDQHFINGFATSDGKFHFSPDWARIGSVGAAMPELPDHFDVIETADGAHPYRLVTAPARNFLNSSFTETLGSQKREGRPEIMLHPDDCTALGLTSGDRVRIGNERASIVLHLKSFDGVQQGVAVVESIWPNAAFEEGLGINALVGADSPPPRGGAAFHDTAIWIKPA